MTTCAISSIDELGESYGFRKIRGPLGVTAFADDADVARRAAVGRSDGG